MFALLFALTLWPATFADTPASDVTTREGTVAALTEMASFEVVPWHQVFGTQRLRVLPEVVAHLQTALNSQEILPVASPAQAQLHVRCIDTSKAKRGPVTDACKQIEAFVTTQTVVPSANPGGGQKTVNRVIWQTHADMFALNGPWFMNIAKDSRQIAQQIIDQLVADYTAANEAPL
ncbi:MAG: hypothetical protein VKJ06_07425 [Vampirovibrionales bacterium]|nr:hypothetical protein [Vampirovibrionales bacterium]